MGLILGMWASVIAILIPHAFEAGGMKNGCSYIGLKSVEGACGDKDKLDARRMMREA